MIYLQRIPPIPGEISIPPLISHNDIFALLRSAFARSLFKITPTSQYIYIEPGEYVNKTNTKVLTVVVKRRMVLSRS